MSTRILGKMEQELCMYPSLLLRAARMPAQNMWANPTVEGYRRSQKICFLSFCCGSLWFVFFFLLLALHEEAEFVGRSLRCCRYRAPTRHGEEIGKSPPRQGFHRPVTRWSGRALRIAYRSVMSARKRTGRGGVGGGGGFVLLFVVYTWDGGGGVQVEICTGRCCAPHSNPPGGGRVRLRGSASVCVVLVEQFGWRVHVVPLLTLT